MAEPAADLHALLTREGQVATGESVRIQHGEDLSFHPPHMPDWVVYPETAEQVASILAYANEHQIPVVPFGAATSLEGHVIPVHGGISLDLTNMNEIVVVRPRDLTVTVQPGVTRHQLARRLGEDGLFFPVDPGADATLGGMAATNASGTTTVRYGSMRRHVLALEVALADGRLVRTGSRAVKSSAGYDMTSVFVGSEGTLGVITELTLRTYGIPETTIVARAIFPSVAQACEAAVQAVAVGTVVERVELLDAPTIRDVNNYKGMSLQEQPTLFLEFAGGQAATDEELAAFRELAQENGCIEFVSERDPTAKTKLWEARHEVAFAVQAAAPGKKHKSTDVCVPISELPAAVAFARSAISRLGFEAAVVGHVGDGNYHIALMVDPNDQAEVMRAEALVDELVGDALARGGTCTGEHGIGLGKLRHLVREHADLVPLMHGFKQLLDPNGILNPGKVLPPTNNLGHVGSPTRRDR